MENLSKAANHQRPRLDFKYDDYELIYASQLLLFMDDKETVVGLDLKEKITLDKQNFYELYDGWMVKKRRSLQKPNEKRVYSYGCSTVWYLLDTGVRQTPGQLGNGAIG